MIITKEPHEELEIRSAANDTMLLVMKDRSSTMDEWNIRYKLLNKRECLAIHQAITDHIIYKR